MAEGKVVQFLSACVNKAAWLSEKIFGSHKKAVLVFGSIYAVISISLASWFFSLRFADHEPGSVFFLIAASITFYMTFLASLALIYGVLENKVNLVTSWLVMHIVTLAYSIIMPFYGFILFLDKYSKWGRAHDLWCGLACIFGGLLAFHAIAALVIIVYGFYLKMNREGGNPPRVRTLSTARTDSQTSCLFSDESKLKPLPEPVFLHT